MPWYVESMDTSTKHLEEKILAMEGQLSELEKLVQKMLQLLCGNEEKLDEHLRG
jgi:hypothetical protein